ncbi:receptor-type tyrosine-protein phosphatase C isoform X4 [Carassius auratus]|uniref:Receptor-type tyrosine-protein phosphatase C n=1 Tax=Carassius auratus TaxID=7957 RepID=A0A6P6M6F3_CARAU|nr:receptor-type tyrosine-protein phosphatase C isoform X4 [Carassius auratus]
MARFFALGPLVLVLCLVLYNSTLTPAQTTEDISPTNTSEQDTNANGTGSSDSPTTTQPPSTPPVVSTGTGKTDTQSGNSTLTTAPNTANATEDNSTLTTAPNTANATEGNITLNDKANTPTSLPNTTTQQHNTSTTTGKVIDNNETKTSISPTHTSTHEQNTSTTAATGLSPTSTPSHTPSVTVKGVGNDTTSPPHSNTGSPTSMHSSSTSPPPTTILSGPGKDSCRYQLIAKGNEEISIMMNISDSKRQKHTIWLLDKDHKEEIPVSNESTIPLKLLKPCTNYSVEVDECTLLGENHFNLKVSRSENHSAELMGDGQVCFKDSKWNLTKCVNITTEDSCVEKPIDINLETCIYTMNVLMPPVKPEITYSETIPTKFVWKNKIQKSANVASKCNGTFEVSCTYDNAQNTYGLGENVYFVPFKMYNCTGKYKYYNKFINSSHKMINISCDWKNVTLEEKVNNDSIVISWTQYPGDKCPGITWEGFSGICGDKHGECHTLNASTANCTFNSLSAYTEYNCKLSAQINQSIGQHSVNTSFKHRTLPYIPIFKEKRISVSGTSHNSFSVTCNELVDWNGEKGIYIAKLKNKNTIEDTKRNKHECSFLFGNLYYHTNYTFEITAENGNGFTSSPIKTHKSTSYNDKAVIGFLVFLIILTSVALLFVLYKLFLLKRKRNAEDEQILLTPAPLRRVEPIPAAGLVEAYKNKIADEGRLFMDEFQSIPRIFSNYTIKEAKKPDNQYKNRYVDILPYDYNRVTLSTGGEDNYINASFIEGYREAKKYIAAQGPKDETVVDFWRMVWEQKSSIIVMVTRCEEGNKIKCAQYWPSPDREAEIFDEFVVQLRSEEHCPDYIIRRLILTNKQEKASEREVTHIQFISWPDHGVPGDPSLLLKLRRRVNSFKNFFSGPVVVHCSAGVGRTGTYMGIDAMIESLEAEGRVDIYGFVAKLRRQRCLMVQVETQYILIHTALIEYNQFGDTEIPLSEFHSVLKTLRQKNGSNNSSLELEFQKLPKFKKWRTNNTGSSEENKKKNRDSAVIPYDFNRVIFRLDIEGNQTSDPEDEDEYTSDEEDESDEYINASFIDGYWCNKSLIAAQGPLPNTVEEFLLMLYQQQTKTLVMLTDCQEDGKDFCFQYWGDEKKTYGDMEIEVKKTESFPTYVRRHLEIQSLKKKEVLEVDQYQFLKWKGRELPEDPQELIEMARIIRENGKYDNSKMNRNVPIVVHCHNGSSRTGIFCALWNLLDSAYTEKLVDVLQVVKNLRKMRQGIVETIEQYQFLYAALEGAFPVQNGAVKTPSAKDTAQVINETTALLTEPNSTSGADQKEAGESSEREAKESSTAEAPPAEGDREKPSPEAQTNGPAGGDD